MFTFMRALSHFTFGMVKDIKFQIYSGEVESVAFLFSCFIVVLVLPWAFALTSVNFRYQ